MLKRRQKQDRELQALIDRLSCPRALALAEKEVKEILAKAGREHERIRDASHCAPRRILRSAA